MKMHVRALVLLAVVGVLAVSAVGKDAPVPTGEVALTVSGTIALTNGDGVFAMDDALLRALPQVAYFVEDPWMGGNTYGGVLLSTLLEYVGFPLGASQVVLVASDEKEFPIAIADALTYPIMLVMDDADGALLPSLGGPIKVAYPYAAYPEVQTLYPPEQWAWWVVEVRIEY
ncbi:molybdopterin-dependent oxidoreductase [Candidatus Bipolaricaulota bacterium]|nr:molybdopterin-dependent oxidoreductase [Candidatus Bipolaricaulota bacterium]